MTESDSSPQGRGDLDGAYPPPVDFRLLVAGFVGQAMSALGKLPHPVTGKTDVDLPWARYFIDVLGMLEEKTKGNLDPVEASELQQNLGMLRLTYVDTQKSQDASEQDASEQGTGEAPEATGETPAS